MRMQQQLRLGGEGGVDVDFGPEVEVEKWPQLLL